MVHSVSSAIISIIKHLWLSGISDWSRRRSRARERGTSWSTRLCTRVPGSTGPCQVRLTTMICWCWCWWWWSVWWWCFLCCWWGSCLSYFCWWLNFAPTHQGAQGYANFCWMPYCCRRCIECWIMLVVVQLMRSTWLPRSCQGKSCCRKKLMGKIAMDRVDRDWGIFSTQVLHHLLLCTWSEFCGPRFHFIGQGHFYTCDSLSTIEVHFAKVTNNDFFEGGKETQWCLS